MAVERHPIISDTLAVIERELGAAKTLRLVAGCAITQATETVPQLLALSRRHPAGQQMIEDETAYGLWASLWDALAEAKPAAFVETALIGKPAPTTLAFLYAKKQSLLRPYRPNRAEQKLLGAAREALRRWTGLTKFGTLDMKCFDRNCLPLRSLEAVDGWVGMSLADQPALADQIVIDGRYISRQRRNPGGPFEITSLIVHEEIHGAYAVEQKLLPPLYAHKLACAVNEACTSLLEVAAVTVADEGRATLTTVRGNVAEHGYRKPILALMSLLPSRLSADEVAAKVCEIIHLTLTGRTDDAAIAAVNRVLGRRLCFDDYDRLFGAV